MVPDEVRIALEALIGGYAQYVVLAFFLFSVVLVNFRNLRDLWQEFLPRRRAGRDIQARVDFAEKLCALAEKQTALGVDLVDVRAAFAARFPDAARAPAPEPRGPEASLPRFRLILYGIAPLIFTCLYLLLVGGVLIAVAVEIGVPEEPFTDALSIAMVIVPFALVIWAMLRTPAEIWRKGYMAAMGAVFLRVLWGGALYFPLLGGVLYLFGVRP